MNTSSWVVVTVAAVVIGLVIGTSIKETPPPQHENELYRAQRLRIHEAMLILADVSDIAEKEGNQDIYDMTQTAANILALSPENVQRWVPAVSEPE